jgi:phosphatidylethanolamine-binding protein (PEBP) family uncharacterized protein
MLSRRLATLSVLVLTVVVAGCGSSTPAVDRSPEILFLSPAVNAAKVIPSKYACSENKIWIPLEWGALPPSTQEVVVYVARYGSPERKPNGSVSARLLAQSLIVGLKPKLHELRTGKLPAGALVGSYGAGGPGSGVCPSSKHTTQDFLFRLYALPRQLHITAGSKRAELLNTLNSEALAAGTFTASYARA